MRGIVTVTRKEIRDSLRDRRTILNSLVMGPVLGPLLFIGMITMITEKEVEKAQETLELPVVGADHAPNLIGFLQQQGVEILDPPADPERAVAEEEHDVVLRVPVDYPNDWQAGRPAAVELIADHSRRQIDTTLSRVRNLVNTYSRQTGQQRIRLRGVDPGLMYAVVVQDVDLSTPESRGALILGMLPYFVMLTLFVGGMSIAIDATAGEKERRSLEPLLINPLPRWHFMAGKLAATMLFTLISLALALIVLSIGLIPADLLGFQLNVDWAIATRVFALTAPVAIISAGLLTTLAAFAKSFREAQSYMSMVVLLPLLPSLWLVINPVQAEQWMMWVPLLAQNVLILELIRGETLEAGWTAISMGSTTAIGLALGAVAGTLYNRPKLVFSGT